jgi:hypothetical protein
MFQHPFRMNERCPVCHHQFDEGHGYFIGAMYISYGMMTVALGVATLVLWLTGVSYDNWLPYLLAWVVLVGPFTFCYSRLIWILVERNFFERMGGDPPIPSFEDDLDEWDP